MASITIRQLGDETKHRLRVRAAQHGRSMEEEARDILRGVLSTDTPASVDLASAIHARLGPLGGIELDLPVREAVRPPPDFG